MRFVDEYRSGELAAKLSHEIAGLVEPGREVRIMEVCGGHTHAISKHGLEDLVPDEVDFLHGPGCPVCVIPMGRVDDAIFLAEQPGVTFTTFGDMLRVPGGRGSLLEAKARGADVRMVYSPLDALELARANPDREVVFFAIGFETTAPATALTLLRARERRVAQLQRLLQPRHDRPAAAGDPRLARPAARRLHRARPRLDRDRHAHVRLHRRATTGGPSSSRPSSRSTSSRRSSWSCASFATAAARWRTSTRGRAPRTAIRARSRRSRRRWSCARRSSGAASAGSSGAGSACDPSSPTGTPRRGSSSREPRRGPQGVPVRRGAGGRDQAVGVQGLRHRLHAGTADRDLHGLRRGRLRGLLQLRGAWR